jgi:hypothetical protein
MPAPLLALQNLTRSTLRRPAPLPDAKLATLATPFVVCTAKRGRSFRQLACNAYWYFQYPLLAGADAIGITVAGVHAPAISAARRPALHWNVRGPQGGKS